MDSRQGEPTMVVFFARAGLQQRCPQQQRKANIKANQDQLIALGLASSEKEKKTHNLKRKKREPKNYGSREKHYEYNELGMAVRDNPNL